MLKVSLYWVVDKELNLSHYIGETISTTTYAQYGTLSKFPNSKPVEGFSGNELRAQGLGFEKLSTVE